MALGGNHVVLRHFVNAMPETVNLDLGHAGDPLSQSLHRKKVRSRNLLANPRR